MFASLSHSRFYIKWYISLLSPQTAILIAFSIPLPLSTLCSAEITFKTDPKNTDYLAEHGASRNFEPWREVPVVEEDEAEEAALNEENDSMKILENRTQDSKREMAILDALQDIRARNARHERVAGSSAAEEALEARAMVDLAESEEDRKRRKEDAEDDLIVGQYFTKVAADPSAAGPSTSSAPSTSATPLPASASPTSAPNAESEETETESPLPSAHTPTITIKRKADFLEPDLEALMAQAAKVAMPKAAAPPSKKKKNDMASKLGIKVKPKVKT